MPREKSCGAVLYTIQQETLHYLLVQTNSGHVGFSKGHVEPGETEEETARREIYEETALAVGAFELGFREPYTYLTRTGNEKNVVYFLASFDAGLIQTQQAEIRNFWVVPLAQALELLDREREREILRLAEDTLRELRAV